MKLSASDRSDIHTAIKYRVLILSDNHHLSLAAATPLRLSAAILVYMFFFTANETKNTYANIPADKLINIISSMSDINYADKNIEQEVIEFCNVILDPNCFHYKGEHYTQRKVIAKGAHSSLFSEIFLQALFLTP